MSRLRDRVNAFEAALTLALAEPKKHAVHALRTATRRVEALLETTDGAAGAPKKIVRLLKKVRKAAGAVRDFDVQRKLLQEIRQSSTDAKARREAKELRGLLKRSREAEAKRLVEELERHSLKLGPLLEGLLENAAQAEPARLSSAQLAEQTRQWFRRQVADSPRSPTAGQLHEIRKAAKLARYMAEAEGGEAERVAAHFEQIQQSGGDWHDALLLRRLARNHFGKRSPLAVDYKQREQAALAEYRREVARI